MKYKYSVSANFRHPEKPAFRRPLLRVDLYGPKMNIPVAALLDSGADNCLFNIGFAKPLGFDLEKCERIKTTGVEGGGKDVFLTEMEIKPEYLPKIKIPVGFIDSPSVGGLLGQVGFFDAFRIKFARDHDTFEIVPVK